MMSKYTSLSSSRILITNWAGVSLALCLLLGNLVSASGTENAFPLGNRTYFHDLAKERLARCDQPAPAIGSSTSEPTSLAPPVLFAVLDTGPDFDYAQWSNKVKQTGSGLQVDALSGRGGFGLRLSTNLQPHLDRTPAIEIRVDRANEMKGLSLLVRDKDNVGWSYQFDLSSVSPETWVTVPAQDGMILAIPHALHRDNPKQFLDLSSVSQIQIVGNWKNERAAFEIGRISLLDLGDQHAAQHAALALKYARESDTRETARIARNKTIAHMLTTDTHSPAGPAIEHIGLVGPDLLALELQAGRIPLQKQIPYEARPEDEIRLDGNETLVWEGDAIVKSKITQMVYRPNADGEMIKIGALAKNAGKLWPAEYVVGDALVIEPVSLPEAYRIQSDDDPNYTQPLHPTAVHRKSTPNDYTHPEFGRDPAIRHFLYLRLPHPLTEGATYRIQPVGLNTRDAEVTYTHRPKRTRSEAIHATHIGYRPDDPFKRAYFSIWLGDGGAYRLPHHDRMRFQILCEKSGEAVYEGPVELHWDVERDEGLRSRKNHSQTNVYRLDFHILNRPGEYRVYVEGIGTSYPFAIADDSWEKAFVVSMHGFLSHRSGMALGPPLTDYVRPRGLHPDDGAKPMQIDRTAMEGESALIRESLTRLIDLNKQSHPPIVKDAWGGYMDAGDWDSRSEHLDATLRKLELMEMFPDYFKDLKLPLPEAEANDHLPDLLNEALWNLAFFRRLQLPDGGVRGGVEFTAHPRPGETSWQNSLLMGVYAPDPMASYRFAAAAARFSRAVLPYDKALSADYQQVAIKAYAWGEKHEEEHLAKRYEGRRDDTNRRNLPHERNLAAAELLWTTGGSRYHDHLESSDALSEDSFGNSRKLAFTYARMPESLTRANHREAARRSIVEQADRALEFGDQNAWGISTSGVNTPMIGYVGYWSVPEMQRQVLLRAHFLTDDTKYLVGALRAAHYSAGANPQNRTYTTGVGHNPPRAINQMDARASGQEPPIGITVYGQTDPAMDSSAINWMHRWFLSRDQYPDSRSWPAHEAYVDAHKWPAMTEYTVHQTFGRISYYWGYLAARRHLHR